VELIAIKIKLEKELKECEGAFQWDEVIVDSCSHLMLQFNNWNNVKYSRGDTRKKK
jgi:hypothetical protein